MHTPQTEPSWLKPPKRKYAPENLTVTGWESVAAYFRELETRELKSLSALKQWLLDWGEIQAIATEEGVARNIRMTCHTDNEAYKKAFLDYIEQIEPPLKEANFNLCKKYYECPFRKELGPEFVQLDSVFSVRIELFSKENLDLERETDALGQTYQEITGSWTVQFRGQEKTMPEMNALLQANRRELREEAWQALIARRLEDREKLDALFLDMFSKRQAIARNLGLKNYREYIFKRNRREYTAQDCFEFHESVLKAVVPLVQKIREQRRRQLGVPALRPWDLNCDPRGKAALAPFKDAKGLQDGVEAIFAKVDPRLKDYFHSIRHLQDLESRKGKAPGGYQATYDERRIPFIFTNAAGLQDDVETLLHEAGHAFHTLQMRDQGCYWYLDAPMEFCEVSSMSQELIGGHHFGVFYGSEEEGRRARKLHLESVLEVFPWVMTVDAFQHRIYEQESLKAGDFAPLWLKEHERFEAGVDWSGLNPLARPNFWHKQLHIFLSPFYYIEYAISQLGSLQIYRNYRKSPKQALDRFLSAMALGGSRSCREIYKTAGIEFRFDEPFVKELAEMVADELEELADV